MPTDKDNIFKHPLGICAMILKKFFQCESSIIDVKIEEP